MSLLLTSDTLCTLFWFLLLSLKKQMLAEYSLKSDWLSVDWSQPDLMKRWFHVPNEYTYWFRIRKLRKKKSENVVCVNKNVNYCEDFKIIAKTAALI